MGHADAAVGERDKLLHISDIKGAEEDQLTRMRIANEAGRRWESFLRDPGLRSKKTAIVISVFS